MFPRPHSPKPSFRRNRAAFTLVELLTVIAVVATLTGIGSVIVKNVGKSSTLKSAANQVVSTCAIARQNSMVRNGLTIMAVVSQDEETALSVFVLETRLDGAPPLAEDWRQVSNWEILPKGAVVQEAESSLTSSDEVAAYPLPQIEFRGKKVDAFKYVTFVSGGRLNGTQTPVVKLVEGVRDASGQTQYTGILRDGRPANYHKVCLVPSTGLVKVERP